MNLELQNPHKREWNILIILDACRYDIFKEVNEIEGELLKLDSGVKHTRGWYRKYWNGDHQDIQLITQHVVPHQISQFKNFYEPITLWEDDNWLNFNYILNEIENLIDEDKRRYLIHLIPPHLPYQSPIGKEFMEKLNSYSPSPNTYKQMESYGRNNDWEEIKEIYRKEVSWVLKQLSNSNINMDIITTDHGEMIGENNNYGHNNPHDIIRTVPWLEVKNDIYKYNQL